jgi:hypothetical protein
MYKLNRQNVINNFMCNSTLISNRKKSNYAYYKYNNKYKYNVSHNNAYLLYPVCVFYFGALSYITIYHYINMSDIYDINMTY